MSCTLHTVHFPLFSLQHQYLTEALHWRAQTDPDHVLFVLLNAKVPDLSLHMLEKTISITATNRVAAICALLLFRV